MPTQHNTSKRRLSTAQSSCSGAQYCQAARRNRPRLHRLTCRRGVAAVELALCLPILALIMLGTVETCTMIHLQQNLKIAAYEGARVAILPTAEAENVEVHVEQMLLDRGIEHGTVTISPSDIPAVPVGDFISITVSAPCLENSSFRNWFFQDREFNCQVQMMKEF